MNPYTTRTRAQIQPHDLANTLFADAFIVAPALTALERHRGWQAEAEMDRLLKRHSVMPPTAASLIATVRQIIGTSLVRAGKRLAAAPARGASPATGFSNGTLHTTG
jgi:hypothetical protein